MHAAEAGGDLTDQIEHQRMADRAAQAQKAIDADRRHDDDTVIRRLLHLGDAPLHRIAVRQSGFGIVQGEAARLTLVRRLREQPAIGRADRDRAYAVQHAAREDRHADAECAAVFHDEVRHAAEMQQRRRDRAAEREAGFAAHHRAIEDRAGPQQAGAEDAPDAAVQ